MGWSGPRELSSISKALCIKAGNAVILRGGKEAIRTNSTLAALVREAVTAAGLPKNAVQFVESTDRALVGEMLEMEDVYAK